MSFEPTLPFFVYGTLRAREVNSHRLRGAVARSRPGTLQGATMFDLGPYPMIVETKGSEAAHSVIIGELIDIESSRYVTILRSLDILEGVDPRHPDSNKTLYRRVQCNVSVQSGESVTAWVYFGREEVARRGRFLPHGDWRRRFEKPVADEEIRQREASGDC